MQQQIPFVDDNKKSNSKNKYRGSSPFDFAQGQNDKFLWMQLCIEEELSVAHNLFFAVGVT